MKALITGIGGFVASHLAHHLLINSDWNIYGTHRWNEPLDNLDTLTPFLGGRVILLEADLNDRSSLDQAIKQSRPDYIFHLAAQSYVRASFFYPAQTLQTNVLGTLNLLESIRTHAPEAWVHNCSSSEVYGRVSPDYGPIDEKCPLMPASPYSISKVGADMLGRYYSDAYGLNVVTTRMFTHTGPRRGDVFSESSFAKQIAMIETGLMNPPIKVGNLQSTRTIADVRDAVRAYHMLLTVNPQRGEYYNIGGTYTCTVRDILEQLMKISGRNHNVEVDPTRLRPLDVDHQIPNCSKFMNHTGWKPEVAFEQTMRDLLEYWRNRVKHSVVVQR